MEFIIIAVSHYIIFGSFCTIYINYRLIKSAVINNRDAEDLVINLLKTFNIETGGAIKNNWGLFLIGLKWPKLLKEVLDGALQESI